MPMWRPPSSSKRSTYRHCFAFTRAPAPRSSRTSALFWVSCRWIYQVVLNPLPSIINRCLLLWKAATTTALFKPCCCVHSLRPCTNRRTPGILGSITKLTRISHHPFVVTPICWCIARFAQRSEVAGRAHTWRGSKARAYSSARQSTPTIRARWPHSASNVR